MWKISEESVEKLNKEAEITLCKLRETIETLQDKWFDMSLGVYVQIQSLFVLWLTMLFKHKMWVNWHQSVEYLQGKVWKKFRNLVKSASWKKPMELAIARDIEAKDIIKAKKK